MNTTSVVRLANEQLKIKNYKKALNLYQLAASELGEKNFKWNIDYCGAKLPEVVATTYKDNENTLNSFFDNIYLVNLKSAINRRISVCQHLNQHKISYEIFEAVNGYKGVPYARYKKYSERNLGDLKRYPEFSEMEVKRGKPLIESAGAMGYIFTYLNILKDAKANGYKNILILEDDIILHNNFFTEFKKFSASVGMQWKILQLGASQYKWTSVDEIDALKKGLYHPRRLDTCGSFAIGIDASVFDELIEAESSLESPFDHLALGEIYERHLGSCFVSYPNIVMPDVASSSIRGGRSQIAHSEKMRWRIKDYVYPLPKPSISILLNSEKNLKYLDSFEKQADRPFNLRLYFNSEDGLRPVHNKEAFLKSHYKFVPIDCAPTLPACDFVASIDGGCILTEQDITSYLESQIFGLVNKTILSKMSANMIRAVALRVSIIIPTYSRPKNLLNALESAAQQDYLDKEIIVVSDNAGDSEYVKETLSIVEKVQKGHPSVVIKLIQHTHNRNGSAARNTGMLQSTGEFICFLDDDDIYLPGRISLSVAELKKARPNVGAVYCGFLGWNSPSNDVNRYKVGDLTKELLLLEYKKHYMHTNTATYRRTALFDINGFDESYRRHQDIELNLRFFEKYEVEVVKKVGVRLNPEPSDVSNKIFNTDMLNLKQKFLAEFRSVIEKFDAHTQKIIYDRHWGEVARYTTDNASLISHLTDRITDGPTQVLLKLDSQIN